jgi:hypothetical protein
MLCFVIMLSGCLQKVEKTPVNTIILEYQPGSEKT